MTCPGKMSPCLKTGDAGEEHLTGAAGEIVPDLGQLDDVAPHAPGAAAAAEPEAVTVAEDAPDGGEGVYLIYRASACQCSGLCFCMAVHCVRCFISSTPARRLDHPSLQQNSS